MEWIRQLDQYLLDIENEYYSYPLIKPWAHDSIVYVVAISVLYVLLAYAGVRWMRDRPKFTLRRSLVCWNAGLAWYSIYSLYRFMPGFINEKEPADRICSTAYMLRSGGMWGFAFALSKFAELGDTVFVVLKKKKLIFLHWFHHLTVMWFCWFSYIWPHGPGRLFAMINMFIHSIMYIYYGVVAAGLWRLPKWINVTITTLQLSQMIIGALTTLWAYNRRLSGLPCELSDFQFALAMMVYGTYGALFANFFYNAYLRRPARNTTPEAATNHVANGN